MAEPEVRFCTAKDGVSIAYMSERGGDRLPVICVHTWPITIEGDTNFDALEIWGSRHSYRRLGRTRQVVQFDRRGVGSSQREVDHVSVETGVAEISGVADHLELSEFGLYGSYDGAVACLAYAARHPDRVAKLVLWAPFASSDDLGSADERQGLVHLVRTNWRLARRTLADIAFPTGPPEAQRLYYSLLGEHVSQDVAALYLESYSDMDVMPLLDKVTMPTLVIHRRGDRSVPSSAGRRVAGAITNARLLLLDGAVGTFISESEADDVLDRLEEFLDDGLHTRTEPALPSGMTAILFADIADSTALTEQLGDTAFREKAKALDAALREAITGGAGTPIDGKLLGDGVLATFSSAREAIDAARRCRDASAACGLGLHLGIHAGDVIREANNVFGGAVNLAARIADACKPGEILVSDTLRGLARTSAGVVFEDRGEYELKGIAEPVRLFVVRESAGGA